MPSGRAEAFPERPAVFYGKMRHREAQFRSRPARPGAPPEDGRLRPAVARKAEGEAHLRLLERQFRNYFEKAERAKGPTGENLIVMLERRLDNVV